MQRKPLERECENPVPHYWELVLWVWGQPDIATFIEFSERVSLNGVVEKITCPLLIIHGEGDRQTGVDYAHQSYEQAVNAPTKQLRIFTAEEGATEHCGLDHLPHAHGCVHRRLGGGHPGAAGRRLGMTGRLGSTPGPGRELSRVAG